MALGLGALLGLGAVGTGLNFISQGWAQGHTSSENELNRDFNALEAEKSRSFSAQQAALARDFSAEQAQLGRDFTSNENALTRAFNSREAALARDWSERMDSTALQRKVQDAKLAGFNPAMLGGMSSSMPSAKAASASASTSYSAPNASGVSGATASYHGSGGSHGSNPGNSLLTALRSAFVNTAKQNSRDFSNHFLDSIQTSKSARFHS